MNEYICHRHQTSGQAVQMFYNWTKDFADLMNKMPHISQIKVTSQDIENKEPQKVPVRQVLKTEKKPKTHKPYQLGNATLVDAFKQVGM